MKALAALLILFAPRIAIADSTRCVSVVPTIDTAAYSTGDVMGSEMEFASILKDSTKAGYITSVTIADAAAQAVDIELVVFDQNPSAFGSDNAAFDPTDTDLKAIRASILFGSSQRFAYNDNSLKQLTGISYAVGGRTSSNIRSLYGALVARGAYDGDADSLTVTICVSQD